MVPTWNYAVVQASGPLRVVDDREWLRSQIEALTRSQEQRRSDPWEVADAPAPYVEAMIRGIVGIEIPILRLEGKWKVSQNRPAADRRGVIAGLSTEAPGEGGDMAELVKAFGKGDGD